MQRIVILGNAGSGKSTLARALGKRLSLPVVHLDTLFWEPGWVEPDAEQFRARVREAIAPDAWICEGNYARRTFDLRLPRTDLIIWLDTSRLTCFTRVIMRSVMNRPRPDLAAGCTEKARPGVPDLSELRVEFRSWLSPRYRGGAPGHRPANFYGALAWYPADCRISR